MSGWLAEICGRASEQFDALPTEMKLAGPCARHLWAQRVDRLKAKHLHLADAIDALQARVRDDRVRQAMELLSAAWDEHVADHKRENAE